MNLNELTPAELRDFLMEAQAKLKDADSARRDEYAVLGLDFFAHVIANSVPAASKTSDWAGYAESGIEIEVDGMPYSVSLRITDKTRQANRVEGVDYTPRPRKGK